MSLDNLDVNKPVLFRSLNPNDTIVWKGEVVSLCNYRLAKQYGDILSYHTAIKKIHPEIGNIEDLDYFIMDLSPEDNPDVDYTTNRVFAKEWIETGSFILLDEATKAKLAVFDITEDDLSNIIDMIKLRGYHVERE